MALHRQEGYRPMVGRGDNLQAVKSLHQVGHPPAAEPKAGREANLLQVDNPAAATQGRRPPN